MSEWVNSELYKHVGVATNGTCRIGKSYLKPICVEGCPCVPVEGHFITECANCTKY